jgi:hypothetical protein
MQHDALVGGGLSCLASISRSFPLFEIYPLNLSLHLIGYDPSTGMALADLFTLSWVRSDLWDRLRLQRRVSRDLIIGLVVGITFSLSSTSLALLVQQWRRKRAIARIPPRPIELRSDEIVDGVTGLIGESHSRISATQSQCINPSRPRTTQADLREVILPYYASTR